MKTKIYVVRHCEAAGNIERYFQGHTDGLPSPKGEHQCELLGKREEALAALERAEDPTTPSPEPARELAPRICGLVRYRLEHPDYLERPEYGAELMELFETMRRELPIGYASFHLPRVLEWLRARRMYRQAYELLLDFPRYRALNKT